MGYYSDVQFALSKKEQDNLTRRSILGEIIPELITENTPCDREDFFIYDFGSCKWYATYSDVKEFTEYMKRLPEEDYQFIRVGEESNDIEELGDIGAFYVKSYIEEL